MSLTATSSHLLNTSIVGDSATSLTSLVIMSDNRLGEEVFPNIQCKPFLLQLEAFSSHSATCYMGEVADLQPTTTSFRA